MEKIRNKGFTLIELVIVIVILGILAAIAIPKYIDLQNEADQAAVDALAGNLASASSINYASRKTNATHGQAVTNCTDGSSLLDGGLPTGYSITAGAVGADATVSCTLTSPNANTATFTIIGIA